MKKILVLLVCGLLVGASVADASVNSTQDRYSGKGVTTVVIKLPSIAQNVLDTTYVDISDADWALLAAAAPLAGLPFSIGATFAASCDSVRFAGIGYSNLGSLWVEQYSSAAATNALTTTVSIRVFALTVPARMLRIITKNVDATTGANTIAICYPNKK